MWLYLKKKLSSSRSPSPSPEYRTLALATRWWGLAHHQWHQQSKHPKIKLTFRLTRKPHSLQRPRQVVRHNPLLPPMPRSVSRSLSLCIGALQLWCALSNTELKHLVDAQLMQHKDDNRQKEIGKRFGPELGFRYVWKHLTICSSHLSFCSE
jgi:hypothetical protein